VTDEIADAARSLVGARETGPPPSSKQIADRATQACERLSQHLSRLLGEAGVGMLWERSIVLASVAYPWLAAAKSRDIAAFNTAMASQSPDAAIDAFVAVLSSFVGLLERLIGEGLVQRQLDEVWPGVFFRDVKETP